MVLVQYRKNDKNNFTVEVYHKTPIGEVIERLIAVNNSRIYLARLTHAIEELTKKGVLRPAELQGLSFEDMAKHPEEIAQLSEQKKEYVGKPNVQPPCRYVADTKHNVRHGVLLPQEQADELLHSVESAKKGLEPKPSPTRPQQLEVFVQLLRQAVMLAYPGYFGLPEWEPVVLILENRISYDLLCPEEYEFFCDEANLWWTGKQLSKKSPIGDFCGKNDKTKMIVKLQNPGAQQPPREPPIDTETYRKMVQYYHKKTNEAKEFEKEAVSTTYENPAWATPKLKEELSIGTKIKYKPF